MNFGAVCFTGRFQPFHKQHLEVVEAIRDDYAHVIIGITNPDITKLNEHVESSHRHTDQANPFDFEVRREIVLASLSNSTNIEIIPFDLEAPNTWRVPTETTFALRIFSPWELSKQVLFESNGYATQLIQPPASKLSASSIREKLAAGDKSWQEQVSPDAFEQILAAWNNSVALRVGN